MNFNRYWFAATCQLFFSCAQASSPVKPGPTMISREVPESFSSSFESTAVDKNAVVLIDPIVKEIQEYSLEPFALQRRWQHPLPDRQVSIFVALERRYFILLGEKSYGVLKEDGTYRKNPVKFAGSVRKAFYDEIGHRLVLVDHFASLIFIRLSAEGEVVDSWNAGPIIPVSDQVGKQMLTSGVLTREGKLVIGFENGLLGMADFDQVVRDKTWQLQAVDVADKPQVTWFASGPEGSHAVLLLHGSGAAVLNTSTGTVSESLKFDTARAVHQSRMGGAHVLLANTSDGQAQNEIISLTTSGTLKRTKISLAGIDFASQKIHKTFLDESSDTVTMSVGDPQQSVQIFSQRLSDSLVMASREVVNEFQGEIIPVPGFVLRRRPSPLGWLEKYSLQDEDDVEMLTGYNRNILSRRR